MGEEDYAKYSGKKVIIVLDQGEGKDAIEVEGKAETANELGILFKPKGKTKLELIALKDIIEISFAPTAAKVLVAKMLKPLEYGNARTHLLERHGVALASVSPLSEDEAFEWHEDIDHVEDDLGHFHGVKVEAEASVEA